MCVQKEPQPPRKKRGVGAAMLAGGLVAIENLLGRKPKEDTAEVREATGNPEDIDKHGMTIALNESTTVHSPAPAARSSAAKRVVKRRNR